MFKVGAVSHGVGCGTEIPASYSNVAGDFLFLAPSGAQGVTVSVYLSFLTGQREPYI